MEHSHKLEIKLSKVLNFVCLICQETHHNYAWVLGHEPIKQICDHCYSALRAEFRDNH